MLTEDLIAWQFASKKSGHDLAPDTDEKITDGMRGAYEKFSGKKVDPKVDEISQGYAVFRLILTIFV